MLQRRGLFPQAESAYRRALAVAEHDPGSGPDRRAQHLSNLATALVQQAGYEEAEALLREAVALARSHFGDAHPGTATLLNNLGTVLREQERLDEAEEPLREALAIRRRLFDGAHPALATSVNNVADLLLARGDAAAAEPLFRESLQLRRALLGERHAAVGNAWINLGATLQRLDGRTDEAVQAYDAARAVLLASVGPGHPLLGAVDGNLGRLYHDTGEHARALDHLRAALAVRRDRYDAVHPLVLGTLSDIGRCLTELRDYDTAESVLLETLAALEPAAGPQARLRDTVLVRLARLYRALGREDDAARYEAMRAAPGDRSQ